MNQQSKDTEKINAIVYLHRRVSDSEVFYVGIGKTVRRAYDSKQRSRFWKAYIGKYPYSVEVLYEGLTWQEACVKEKELIKQYGRRDLGLGTLVNMTDGGEGTVGVIRSELYREHLSTRWKGKKREGHSEKMKLDPPSRRPGVGAKISASKKGQQSSFKGRKHTEESKRKNREVHLGKTPGNKSNLCIHRDSSNKYILAIELTSYLKQGWQLGGKIRTVHNCQGGNNANAKKLLDLHTGILYETIKEYKLKHKINHYQLQKLVVTKTVKIIEI